MRSNKIVRIGIALTCAACICVAAYAGSSTTFYVNGVSITGKITYNDTWDYNPLTSDSVTATTTSKAAMDKIITEAIIYYSTGSTARTAKVSNTEKICTSCSVTAKASLTGVAYKGTATHTASHNGKSNSGSTFIYW